jgi:hypothetical protein
MPPWVTAQTARRLPPSRSTSGRVPRWATAPATAGARPLPALERSPCAGFPRGPRAARRQWYYEPLGILEPLDRGHRPGVIQNRIHQHQRLGARAVDGRVLGHSAAPANSEQTIDFAASRNRSAHAASAGTVASFSLRRPDDHPKPGKSTANAACPCWAIAGSTGAQTRL